MDAGGDGDRLRARVGEIKKSRLLCKRLPIAHRGHPPPHKRIEMILSRSVAHYKYLTRPAAALLCASANYLRAVCVAAPAAALDSIRGARKFN